MKKYHKIQTVFKRNSKKQLIKGQWTLPEFEYLANNDWVADEKIDGMNMRIIYNNDVVEFRGRTDRAQIPAPLFNKLKEKYTSDYFRSLFDVKKDTNICLYGEGYGPKIQSGGKYRKDQDFILFDVMINEWFLKREDVKIIASKGNIVMVPEVFVSNLYEIINEAKIGIKSLFGDFESEGFVARPVVDMYSRNGSRIITKIKCKDFKF